MAMCPITKLQSNAATQLQVIETQLLGIEINLFYQTWHFMALHVIYRWRGDKKAGTINRLEIN